MISKVCTIVKELFFWNSNLVLKYEQLGLIYVCQCDNWHLGLEYGKLLGLY